MVTMQRTLSTQSGEALYEEIDKYRISAKREVIASLTHAPALLDFYVWVIGKAGPSTAAGVRALVWPLRNDWPVGNQRLFG